MKHMLLSLVFIALASASYGACVDERVMLGSDLLKAAKFKDVFIRQDNGAFRPIDDSVIPFMTYHAQVLPKSEKLNLKSSDPFARYNKKYIKYYTYPRMAQFLEEEKSSIFESGYELQKIGKSLEGRDLFYVGPKEIDFSKKTIVMFGRHHGDEGTANWIIEGFFKRFFGSEDLKERFQLILYPMINPDGAMAQRRYNDNGRDLNRSWSSTSGDDEIGIIHGHLRSALKRLKNVVIALDMHGSFREDFIYRVDRGYRGDSFYDLQQKFIDELGAYDPWQNGNFILSNGDPGMSRIVLIKHYNLHALTHESIRNIPLRNSRDRSREDLVLQGEAVAQAIENLY